MDPIPCFMIEPTGTVARWLRRYSPSLWDAAANKPVAVCPDGTYHEAKTKIQDGTLVTITDPDGSVSHDTIPREWPRDDPRWPAACTACGYVFTDADPWQLSWQAVYRRADTGEVVGHLHPSEGHVPAGAMWDTPWFLPQWKGPDGRCLSVMTPAGEWCIDGIAHGGGHWTRTGTPPNLTVTPSIAIGDPQRYHGWLRGGSLVDA